MLKEVVNDYAEYLKLDLCNEFQTIQNVIDNMITRLEELTSVLQMIKLKNKDCSIAITEDICRHRNEVTILSKKIFTLSEIVSKLQQNVEMLEKRVEKAELDFGVQTDNKLKSLFKPFLKRKDSQSVSPSITAQDKFVFSSVLDKFEESDK
ncbi:unnamed protein product [Euphydryas editha]|uniref:Uncharacterized protein n=1 Tax=Euphydryas editha TaxID=104508 RepID=A0AAU9UC25_EUPED|nr:unnamed protein product [Euphydryas editha]